MFQKLVILSLIGGVCLSCSDEKEPKVYRLAKMESPAKAKPSLPKMQEGNIPMPPKPSSPLVWITPDSWEEHEARGMRVGSFTVKGHEEADISLIYLGGAAGGDLPNVNRWREQIDLSAWSEEEFLDNIQEVETGLGEARVTSFGNPKASTHIIGAIIPDGKGTWFLKMIGDQEVVLQNQENFIRLLQSLSKAQ